MEGDEAEDGDEDGPDCLHLVGQDGPRHRQAEDQQVDDLKHQISPTLRGRDGCCSPRQSRA